MCTRSLAERDPPLTYPETFRVPTGMGVEGHEGLDEEVGDGVIVPVGVKERDSTRR